ncbi:MAG TPA: asparaginase [Burkholderiaceae bacterium]|nr:asparaginase [Burkholderiaceae bacterium]
MVNPVLVEAWRGDIVESFHRGAFAVVDAAGALVASAGDIERPVYPRSSIKVLQALPLVESGAADRFGLNDDELALACASHTGEPEHARTAASTLAKAGLDVDVLECGVHWPYDEAAKRTLAAAGAVPSALHNNCSGKHAGFACLGCVMAGGRDARGFLAGYVKPEHALMREVGAAIEATTGVRLADAPRATDGCSIPTWGLPLRRLAHAFARIATGVGLAPGRAAAARRLRAAVARAPFMVGGTDRLDTVVMQAFGERVFCKVGAEGMYCAALPDAGLGLALKMDDGNTARACEVALAALLHAHAAPRDDGEHALLAGLANVTLRNWRGIEVGRLASAKAAFA